MKYKKTKDAAICAYVKSAENEAQEIPIQMDQLDECERFLISASSVPDSADIVEIKLTFLNATAGDDGYYVVATNESSFLVNFRERDNTDYRTKNICMPILGFKRATDTYLLTVTGMQYSYTLRVHVFEGQYSVSVLYDLQETALYEDVILNVYKIEGVNADYNAIAKKYQELQIQKLNLSTALCTCRYASHSGTNGMEAGSNSSFGTDSGNRASATCCLYICASGRIDGSFA